MSAQPITILWGSETGTAQGLAEQAELKLTAEGFQATTVDMSDVTAEQLEAMPNVLVLTSTWGDGDPPSNAYQLWEDLQRKQLNLQNTRFSVCALGDTAYYQFCKAGKDFDEFLEKHGAKRLHPMQECDVDYDSPYEQWLQGIIAKLKQ